MLSLGALLRCVQYVPIDRFPRKVSGCNVGVALLYVPLELIKERNDLSIFRLCRHMAVDSVLISVANSRLTESDWKAMKNQERFPSNYDNGKIMALPAVLPCVRRSAIGV